VNDAVEALTKLIKERGKEVEALTGKMELLINAAKQRDSSAGFAKKRLLKQDLGTNVKKLEAFLRENPGVKLGGIVKHMGVSAVAVRKLLELIVGVQLNLPLPLGMGRFSKDKTFTPIRISEEGLELIELISLDCENTKEAWHSTTEIKIDKLGYTIQNGIKTKTIWNAKITSPTKPKRLKIRNISGDETVKEIE